MAAKFDFTGHQILITGGARGLGLQMSRQFLEAGASVVIWDFSDEALGCAKNELSTFNPRVSFQNVDVADRNSVSSAAGQLGVEIDVLINNAGIARDKSFAKMSDADFDDVLNTNLRGVFVVTQTLLGHFKPSTSDKRIINIASVVALYGNFGQTNYVAAKAGVIGLTKTWARELARKGFTVNAVAPGFIETAMTEAMPTESLNMMTAKIPVGRLGQPSDVANACLFLASKQASYINGTVVSVDGGLIV